MSPKEIKKQIEKNQNRIFDLKNKLKNDEFTSELEFQIKELINESKLLEKAFLEFVSKN